ncbi:MAG: hypothetical protein ACOYOV_05815 [Bacteroidales bacterium]
MEKDYLLEIENLNNTISSLTTVINEMRNVFHELAKPIREKGVYALIEKLQNIQDEAFQIGIDKTLNSYEEFCLMIQDGSVGNYPQILEKMWNSSKEVSAELTPLENFIITHYCFRPDYQLTAYEEIGSDFHIYVCEFGSKMVENFGSILW